MDLTLMSDKVT